jgi:lipoate-protein ligase B
VRGIAWTELECFQADLARRVASDPSRAFLLLSEPQPTFTAGLSARPADLIWPDEARAREGVAVARIDRAGQWTYHGPGQLLVYPIVFLPAIGLNRRAARLFLDTLRAAAQAWLSRLPIPVEAPPHSGRLPYGLYAGGRKLVSFGISLRGGISTHGMALYLADQRRFFAGIHPCGVPGAVPISVEEVGGRWEWEDAGRDLATLVKKGFQELRN